MLHEGANLILKSVADCLRPRGLDPLFRYSEKVEPTEPILYRYGGDEFIILASGTTIGGGTDPITYESVNIGLTMTSRLQSIVWDQDFAELATARKRLGQPTKLTVSAGIADSIPSLDPNDTADKLTRRAELALLEAKRVNKDLEQKDQAFKGTVVPYRIDLDHPI